MSLGNTLRAAREACGITTSELAARTHMLVQIVEGLENEDFRRIPAPIYGRGFVKLYCEAVNLDPKPLQAEFMELFNRPKETFAKPLTAPTPVPAKAAEADTKTIQNADTEISPQPVGETAEPSPRAMADLGDLFSQPATPIHPAAQPAPIFEPVPPKKSYEEIFGQTYAAKNDSPKVSAAKKFRDTMSNVSSGVFANVQKLPPNTSRLVAVFVCAIVVISLIGWGVSALYKATTPAAGNVAKQAEAIKAKPAQTKAKAESQNAKKPLPAKPGKLQSSGIEIPALYID